MLRRREPTKAVNEAGVTESKSAFSVRRPLQIAFEPPADRSNWRMTGKINWPRPHQSYDIGPTCEWTSDEGTRIWLSAQLRGLTVEFTDRAPDRRRALIVRSRERAAVR